MSYYIHVHAGRYSPVHLKTLLSLGSNSIITLTYSIRYLQVHVHQMTDTALKSIHVHVRV